jgi:hypothetical protein
VPPGTTKTFDFFISYSHADKEWVHDWLVPQLQDREISVCIDYKDFEVGVPTLENIEHAIRSSRKTLIVLTPNWVESEWGKFEGLLVQTTDPAGKRRKLIPILLEECDIPPRLTPLTYADFTNDDRWDFQLDRIIGALETEATADETISESHDEDDAAVEYLRAYQIALTYLLSLQYPWGEWSDRRTSLESSMAERQRVRGAGGPKPNVARTVFALEALEPAEHGLRQYRERALNWIRSNISDGWFQEWALSGTPESETILPNLYLRNDVRHSAESITAFVKWQDDRDPLAALVSNVASSSLQSGFWPESPNQTTPQLLATVYAVEGLGRVITGEFRLPLSDLVSEATANRARSAFRRGLLALEDDCEEGNLLLGATTTGETPYLTGIALFRLAPLANRHEGVARLVSKLVDGLLSVRKDSGWRNTAVPSALQERTEQRTTLRVAAGLAEARSAGLWHDDATWDEIKNLISPYAASQNVLDLDSPDHACMALALSEGNSRYPDAVNLDDILNRADEMRDDFVRQWKWNFEEYLSRLERGRAYDMEGYEELGASIEEKLDQLDGLLEP